MKFERRNVANSAEMINAISAFFKTFDPSFSWSIRDSILDNGAFSKPIFSSEEQDQKKSVNTSALNNARCPLSSLEDTVDLQDFLAMKEKKWHLTSAGWIKSVLLEMCHWIDWKIYVLPVSYIQLGGVIWGGATLISKWRLKSLKHLVFQNNLAYKRVHESQRPQSQV